MRALAQTDAPDLTAATAVSYIVGFIPGCLASLVLPLAFGTTKQFRDKLRHTLVPVRLQSPDRRRSHEYNVFVDMDSDAGILSRHRRLSMEKKLRIEVTYEFEVRNEVVESKEALAKAKKDLKLGLAREEERDVISRDTTSEKSPATVGLQRLEKKKEKGAGRSGRAAPPKPLDLGRSLPPTPELKMGPGPVPEQFQQDLSNYPFSVDSSRWDDTARILPKKPSISFMRGQL